MKILVVTQYFWPEEFRINDICKGLRELGHDVEILTGIPNYPSGKIKDDFSIFNNKYSEYEDMKIKRVPIVPRGKDNSMMLALNYISFMVAASFRIIPLLFTKYDRVFVFSISPITSAIPAMILSKIKKVPSYIYIQDLWPETLYSIVNIKNFRVRKLMKKFCRCIYKSFDKLLIASKGYENILIEQGVNKEKIIYLPQWAENFYDVSCPQIDKKSNEEEFIITFAGNMGKAQSVDTIIDAARLAKHNKKIVWNIIGDGSEFENIKYLVKEYELNDSVRLLGRKPSKDMPMYFAKSDALIVSLRDEYIFNMTLPAKVQSYIAAGKPILGSINGEGAEVIEKSKSGLTSKAESSQELYENVMKLYNMTQEERVILGNNGRKYFEENFTRNKLLNKLEEYLLKL